jgi:hypothetical protein
MIRRRAFFLSASLAAVLLAAAPAVYSQAAATPKQAVTTASAAASKPAPRLTDQELWKLATDYSEPDGTFHSENLVSNEARFQTVLPALDKSAVPGRAYVGVGSEQNFTYIVATRPVMVFIVDIRRGNLLLHLTYKALFELSADRADFVSRLFSRPRPAGLTTTSTPAAIFAAYEAAKPSQALYDQNLKAIKAQLTTRHGFALSAGDLEGLDFVYSSWFDGGPDLRYQLTTGGGGRGGRRGGGGPGGLPTYADLMTADDGAGHLRSYLATEENFTFMKDLETRNMLVPVVGNFGGPKALRSVASYLEEKGLVVSTFYASNVEQYLRQDNIWDNFCASASTMPLDAKSMLIRSERGGFAGSTVGGGGFASQVMPLKPELALCAGK